MFKLKNLMLGGLLSLSVLTPVLGIASANTVDGFTSDSLICVNSFENSNTISPYCEDESFSSDNVEYSDTIYYCFSSEVIPVNLEIDNEYWTTISTNNYCSSYTAGKLLWPDYIKLDNGEESVFTNGALYLSLSPITFGSSAGDSDSSFNSSLYSTISGTLTNYTGSLTNYIPYIIGLGIAVVAILAFRRIIKSWGRRIFRR